VQNDEFFLYGKGRHRTLITFVSDGFLRPAAYFNTCVEMSNAMKASVS